MSDSRITTAQVTEAVEQACLEVGLPLSSRTAIRLMLETPQEQWLQCCDSDCSPCQRDLTRAALRARELLAQPPQPRGAD